MIYVIGYFFHPMRLKALQTEQRHFSDMLDYANALLQRALQSKDDAEKIISRIKQAQSDGNIQALTMLGRHVMSSFVHACGNVPDAEAERVTIVIGSDLKYISDFNHRIAEFEITMDAGYVVVVGNRLCEEIKQRHPDLQLKLQDKGDTPKECAEIARLIFEEYYDSSPCDTLERCKKALSILASLRAIAYGGKDKHTNSCSEKSLVPMAAIVQTGEVPPSIPLAWPVPDMVTVANRYIQLLKAFARNELHLQLLRSILSANELQLNNLRSMKDGFEKDLKRLAREISRAKVERITKDMADVIGGSLAVEGL